jgi:DNA-binding transcriptional ArsR family regulator
MKAKKNPTLNDAMIGEVTDIFGAMGDKSRLRILRALLDAGKPQSQSEMLEETGLTQANISKHLACLVRVGLVTREPRGASVLYSPVLPLVSNLCDLICGHVTEQIKQRYKELR